MTEKLNNKQHLLKYGINIKTNYVYKNFMEILRDVGLPKQGGKSKQTVIDSLNEHTVYERCGPRWIFKENHYGEVKEFPELEDGEILLPYDNNEIYYVSNFGRVWNRRNRKWVTNQEYKGRFSVSLYNYPRILARVVAQTFIPNPENKPEVNHKDENPKNNRADNLEWMTKDENLKYGTRIQRAVETKKKKYPGSGLNKGEKILEEFKKKREESIKERYPEDWGSWKRKPIIESKQKAIQKVKLLILQYNISFEDIYPPSEQF